MASFKSLFRIPNWSNFLPVVKQSFHRFPLPFICILIATTLGLFLVHDIEFGNSAFVPNWLISLAYSAVALTSLKLLAESNRWSTARQLGAAIIIVVTIPCYVWEKLGEVNQLTHLLFSVAVLSSLVFAPYINRRSDAPSVWYFNYQTGVAVFFAGFAALILGVGLALSLASIGYLFEIDIPTAVYGDVWVLCLGLLLPVYIIAHLSRAFDFEDDSCSFPIGVKFITNYILAPMMFAYMAILYTYFLKIIVQWELPRGNLGWMITTFGTIGIVTKLLAYPIRISGTRLLVAFDKYYYHALIVPILLLAVAIGVRIRDYGITEQRYAVVLLALWFSSVALMTIIRKDRFHIKFVPIIIAALTFLASFGPWGAVAVSTSSQVNRFESLLMKHLLLKNGQALKTNTAIPFAERKSLSSIADYLTQSEGRQARIVPWFADLMQQAGIKKLGTSPRDGGRELIELLGIGYVNRWKNEKHDGDFNYQNAFNLGSMLADVSGFDYIGRANLYNYNKDSTRNRFEVSRKGTVDSLIVELSGGLVNVQLSGDDWAEFDLAAMIRNLRQQGIVQHSVSDPRLLTLTRSSTNGRFKARLILEQIHGKVTPGDEIKINSIRYVVMLKFND